MTEERVVLNIFFTEMHATMAKDVLQDEGVKAFVFKEDKEGGEPQPKKPGGVRLIVNRHDADRARRILEPLTSF